MPSKKKRKNLDLTNLDTIKPLVAPEPPETAQRPLKSETSATPPSPPQEEPAPVTTEEAPAPHRQVEEEASAPRRQLEGEAPAPRRQVEEEASAPRRQLEEEAPAPRRQFDRRPQRSEVKPVKTLSSTTNDAGEVFQPGDKILAKAPWGKKALAEITSLFEDDSGTAWAQYMPVEAIPENWSWLGGCARANLLVKA